jgi:hypothetical protein
MVTDSSGDKKPTLIDVGLGLTILLVLVAVVVGVSSLGTPYKAIVDVASYVTFVALVAIRLRTCLRLAKDSEYSGKLKAVAFFLVLGMITVVVRLRDIFRTEDRDYVRLATSIAVLLALNFSLAIVEDLLNKAVAKSQPGNAPDSPGGTSPS